LYFFAVGEGLSRFFYLAFASAIAIDCLRRFRREHRVVMHFGKAVGTVLVHKKQGPRRGARIKYGFLSADEKMYLGTVGGTPFLPKHGQTLLIAYNLENPSINMPLSSFWFYDFSH
jgi:hypothetical protein